MENLVITWREILIVAIVVVAVYAAEVLLLTRSGKRSGRWRKAAPAEPALDFSRELESLRGEVAQLREQLDELAARVERSEKAAPLSSPYGQAIQLAQQGLAASEVAMQCGISRGEAELIVAMHGPGH